MGQFKQKQHAGFRLLLLLSFYNLALMISDQLLKTADIIQDTSAHVRHSKTVSHAQTEKKSPYFAGSPQKFHITCEFKNGLY